MADTYAKHADRMEEKEILASAMLNVKAAGGTVSTSLQSLFFHLLRYKEVLAKLSVEIDAAQRDGKVSRTVSNEEAARLPYLQACLKESLRIHSPVAHGLPRIVPDGGLTVARRNFKAGLSLSVNPWVIHRQPCNLRRGR